MRVLRARAFRFLSLNFINFSGVKITHVNIEVKTVIIRDKEGNRLFYPHLTTVIITSEYY
jgi:hypothetical protein